MFLTIITYHTHNVEIWRLHLEYADMISDVTFHPNEYISQLQNISSSLEDTPEKLWIILSELEGDLGILVHS